MTVLEIIDRIGHLLPAERNGLLPRLQTLEPSSPEDLAAAAQKLVEAENPADVTLIKKIMTAGFYGKNQS